MSKEATRKGVSEAEDAQEEIVVENPRNAKAEDMAARFEAQREAEERAAIEADPSLKALEAAREAELEAEDEDPEFRDDIEDEDESEAEAEDEQNEAAPNGDDSEDPPLEDFIVEHNGQQMVALKVDGELRYLPIEKAKAELQKRESGDMRLQQAHEMAKSLQERERAIRQAELELAARARQNSSPPSGNADVDDEALIQRAKQVVDSMFEGDQEEAAAELAKILRGPISSQTRIDVEAIVQQAEERAIRKIRADEQEREGRKGYKKFADTYKDIVADERLFRVADDMTESIAVENPDWTPTEVMMEAGKRTREWWLGRPEQLEQAAAHEEDLAKRQTRKKQLRPMPRRATAKQERPADTPEESPAEILKQMRASRAQPT